LLDEDERGVHRELVEADASGGSRPKKPPPTGVPPVNSDSAWAALKSSVGLRLADGFAEQQHRHRLVLRQQRRGGERNLRQNPRSAGDIDLDGSCFPPS